MQAVPAEVRAVAIKYLEDLAVRTHCAYVYGAPSEFVEKPVALLSKFFGKRFRLTELSAKKYAVIILQELEKAGSIQTMRDGKGALTGMKIISLGSNTENRVSPKVIRRKVCRDGPPVETLQEPEIREIPVPKDSAKATDLRAPLASPKKNLVTIGTTRVLRKGLQRSMRRAEIKGEHNERRFHDLMHLLLRRLVALFHTTEAMEGRLEHSGRHNPRKHRPDLRDSRGEDVSLYLACEGTRRRLIYDVKSSHPAAKEFNRAIYLFSDQKDAALKKAIVVNPMRIDAEIIEEVLDDIIAVGFTQVRQHKDLIVNLCET